MNFKHAILTVSYVLFVSATNDHLLLDLSGVIVLGVPADVCTYVKIHVGFDLQIGNVHPLCTVDLRLEI